MSQLTAADSRIDNIVCLRHPKYEPAKTSPVLSCKTCCGLFLAELRRQANEKATKAAGG